MLPFYDRVIVGTSDLPIENPDDSRCTVEEEHYFLDLVKRVFPTIPVTRDQIVFRFSGVRPLEYMKAKTTGQITRDHSLKFHTVEGMQVISLVGGKWTSFRAFSEQATDEALKILNKHRNGSTAALPLRGGKNYPADKLGYVKELSEKSKLSETYCSSLLERYGTRAKVIANYVINNKGQELDSIKNWTDAEIKYLIETEKPIHLDDLFLRRSMLGWLGKLNTEVVEEFAKIMGKTLEWDNELMKKEIEHVKWVFFEYHGVTI